ncbi:hypothetical protein MLD38_001264 [Melastoma candidum]|uniref:Uncharacterized protein n=1 Tax=Melastoma candidum TaxID=119954 RepID=A0ACB9SLA8_9MYRT|nr:hypothetical protein MLD38_001264 [Melastoma candidum]
MASFLAKLPSLVFPPNSSVRFLRFSRVASSGLPNTAPPANSSYIGKTFSHVFQECASGRLINPGKQAGFRPTAFVTNGLIQMYVRCSRPDFTCSVFDEMPVRDTVSRNATFLVCGEGGDFCRGGSLSGNAREGCGVLEFDVVWVFAEWEEFEVY